MFFIKNPGATKPIGSIPEAKASYAHAGGL